MAFNDALFQLGMDLTRSSTAQTEEFSGGSAHVAQEDWSGIAESDEHARVVGQKLHFDLTGAKTLSSARSAEMSLRQALELARGDAGEVTVRRSAKTGCLTGRASFPGGHASLEAWPATGYVAVDVTSEGGLRPELLLMGLMDAFAAREGEIKRARSATDGARHKKPIGRAAIAPAPRLSSTIGERARTRRAA